MSSMDHYSFLRSLQARMRVRGTEQLSEQAKHQKEREQYDRVDAYPYKEQPNVPDKQPVVLSRPQQMLSPAVNHVLYNRRLLQLARGQEVDITCGDSTLGQPTISPLRRNVSQGNSKENVFISNDNNNNQYSRKPNTECNKPNHKQSVMSNNRRELNSGEVHNDMHKGTQSRKVQTIKPAPIDAKTNDKRNVSLQANFPVNAHESKHSNNYNHIRNNEWMRSLVHTDENEKNNINMTAKGCRYNIFPFKQQDVIDDIIERNCPQSNWYILNSGCGDNGHYNENNENGKYGNAESSNTRFYNDNDNIKSTNELVVLSHPYDNTALPAPPIIIHYHFANQNNNINSYSNDDNHINYHDDNNISGATVQPEEKNVIAKASSISEKINNELNKNMSSEESTREDKLVNSESSTSAVERRLETSHEIPRSVSVHPASSSPAISTMEPLPPSSAQVELANTITNAHSTTNAHKTTDVSENGNAKQEFQEERVTHSKAESALTTNINDDAKKRENEPLSITGVDLLAATINTNKNKESGKEKEESTWLTSEQEREAMLLRNASRYVQSLENKIDAQMSSFQSHISLLNEESARNALLRKDRDSLLQLAKRLQSEKAQLQRELMLEERESEKVHVTHNDRKNSCNNKEHHYKKVNVEQGSPHSVTISASTRANNTKLQSESNRGNDQIGKQTGLNYSSHNSAKSTLSSSSSSSSEELVEDNRLASATTNNYANFNKKSKSDSKNNDVNLHKEELKIKSNFDGTVHYQKVKMPLPDTVRAVYECTMQQKEERATGEGNSEKLTNKNNMEETNLEYLEPHRKQKQQELHQKSNKIDMWPSLSGKVTSFTEIIENRDNASKRHTAEAYVTNSNTDNVSYDKNSVAKAKERLTELEKYVDQLWKEAQMSNESRNEELRSKQESETNHSPAEHGEHTHNYKHVMPHSVVSAATPVDEVLINNNIAMHRPNNINKVHKENNETTNTNAKSSSFRDQAESNRERYTAQAIPSVKSENTSVNNYKKFIHLAEVRQLLNEIAHERSVIRSETEQWHQYLRHVLPPQAANAYNLTTSSL